MKDYFFIGPSNAQISFCSYSSDIRSVSHKQTFDYHIQTYVATEKYNKLLELKRFMIALMTYLSKASATRVKMLMLTLKIPIVGQNLHMNSGKSHLCITAA